MPHPAPAHRDIRHPQVRIGARNRAEAVQVAERKGWL
jgi:hypothetical protein